MEYYYLGIFLIAYVFIQLALILTMMISKSIFKDSFHIRFAHVFAGLGFTGTLAAFLALGIYLMQKSFS